MKERLDIMLAKKGFYSSRQKAKQAIEMNRVLVSGNHVSKSSALVDENDVFDCLPFEFVSRGGFKLQKALEIFSIDLKGKTVLDIGASTGGFSDVCLQNGAKKVYAVDTGTGQLSAKILNDIKVVNMEKTNYLNLDKSAFADVDFVVIDVSFVSLKILAPKLACDFKSIEIIALIKPQFECGADYAKKHKGIVKDAKMHKKIVDEVETAFTSFGFRSQGIATSPILGGDGNTEFLIYLKKSENISE